MSHQQTKKEADRLRKEIARDLRYAIGELEILLNSVNKGDRLYSSVFHGSTLLQLPCKLECHRMLENMMEEEN